MRIEGEREPGKDPSLWKKIELVFEFQWGMWKRKKQKKHVLYRWKNICSVSRNP
jgi:hypothetical protein